MRPLYELKTLQWGTPISREIPEIEVLWEMRGVAEKKVFRVKRVRELSSASLKDIMLEGMFELWYKL